MTAASTVLEDKTGFMAGDTPAILDIAREQNLWVPMNGEAAEAAPAAEGEKKFTVADLPTEPEFDPNEEYDMWTVVEYTIEDIQADLVCTVSAKADFSEFYQECNFYGDDQMTRTTYDGKASTLSTTPTRPASWPAIPPRSSTLPRSRTSGSFYDDAEAEGRRRAAQLQLISPPSLSLIRTLITMNTP